MTPRLPIALGAVALFAAGAAAQTPASRNEIPKAYTAIREADLRHDIGEMPGPDMRGREGGTIDEMRASIWVAEQYRKIGLKPLGEHGTYFQ